MKLESSPDMDSMVSVPQTTQMDIVVENKCLTHSAKPYWVPNYLTVGLPSILVLKSRSQHSQCGREGRCAKMPTKTCVKSTQLFSARFCICTHQSFVPDMVPDSESIYAN